MMGLNIHHVSVCLCGCVGEMSEGEAAAHNVCMTEKMEQQISFFALSGKWN